MEFQSSQMEIREKEGETSDNLDPEEYTLPQKW